ncbi:MAG: Gfo/Idh/MocA family oxidoreductase [Isosphaeraceae bacterium]
MFHRSVTGKMVKPSQEPGPIAGGVGGANRSGRATRAAGATAMLAGKRPYRAAVIGRTGRGDYGHGLDLALLNQPALTVVAVADESEKGRAAAAKRLGVDRAYADYREMLDREKPEFVSVAPRWVDCHRDMVTACAERGIHVFCEKPLAPDLASADAIVTACERSHVKLAVAFQTRYSPRYERVKELVESGAIGELLELRGRGKEDRRGGGEDLLVLGPHLMDLFRGFLGEASTCYARVTERGKPVGRAEVRSGAEGLGPLAGDRIDAVFHFARTPTSAYFATARPAAGASERFGLLICGSKGVISLGTGWVPPAFLLASPDWTGASRGAKWQAITSAGLGRPETLPGNNLTEANRLIVADLIRAVETDTQPRSSVYDGRASLEMLLACFASHAQGGPVAIPLTARAKHPLESLT